MNTIITIGRQYGSGGHEIAEKLAGKLNVKCYDKEILSRAAKDSGFCEEMIKNHDERPTNSFLYNIVMDSYSFGYNSTMLMDNIPISQKVFMAQFDTIKKIAKEDSCIIIGRCADYALTDYNNCINIFIFGDMEHRTERICERMNVPAEKAKDMIIKKDKQRQSYYNYYTSKKWGRADSYDFAINSSLLGIEGTVDMIAHLIEKFRK
ncbi:MAG: cytidylate kinase-like family protein [Eubacteriales bacterium]